ncbi:MAG TPA: hypothetical protein VGN72_18255 [Tepidisphaeraceae bacterium]|jgi:hypothetical protein|nr:hypothetical protein [Tepidisphaeraceae bacterium]
MVANTTTNRATFNGITMACVVAATVMGAGMTSVAKAATVPFTNNFDGTGNNVDFNAGTNGGTEVFTGSSSSGGWTVADGVYTVDVKSTPNGSGASNTATAALSITGVDTADWTMSSQFTVNSVTSPGFNNLGLTIGFGAFGSTSTFSNASPNKYYLADLSYRNFTATTQGTLRILEIGTSNTTIATNSNAVADADLVNGTTYTLKLSGTYSGAPGASSLTMTLGLYDATGATAIGSSVTGTDTTPLTGTNFGYRLNYNENNKSFNASFDNFVVTNAAAVPEPAAVSLLGLAGLIALRRAKRSI